MRIVSLLPSATEIVCELGLVDQLVAVSHDCDWPPEIAGKPILSESIIASELPSAEIDTIIRQQVHQGRSVYHLDEQQLSSLKPDLILTQELCEVCAPSYTDVVQAANILDHGTRIVSLEPTTVEDILENVRLVGELTHSQPQAQRLIEGLQTRIERVQSRAELVEAPPRVLCLEWLDPLFVAGHWVPEMVELAGGDTYGEVGDHSFEVNWHEIERFNPEVLIIMPCGFDPERTASELNLLTEYEGWEELMAVKQDQVYLVHGSYYFNRPGPRVVTGLEILAKAFHPKLFSDISLPQAAMYKLGN
jgi:iron complex transport system substrate-binding protein